MAAIRKERGIENAYFQVNYKTIEGFSSLLNRKTAGIQCDIMLSSTLYTPPIFSKHSHMSIPLNTMLEQQHHVMAPLDQVCFFYTTNLHYLSLLLVIELVAVPIESDSTPFVLGWGSCPINPLTKDRSPMKIRIPLYEGSACCLLAKEIVKDESVLVDIPGCIVTVFLSSHPTLSKATRFIPENTLVAFDDIIPGLIHTNIPEAFPKVLKSYPLSVEKVALSLVPSVEIFEDDFVKMLQDDIKSQQIAIDERRVKFLPYNGWTTVSAPVMVHMTKAESRTLPGSISSLYHSCLVFRGSLELPPIPPQHLTEIIIQLEYVLKINRQLKPGFPPSSDTITIILCWGVWRPFTEEEGMSSVNERHEIELKQGPGYDTSTIPNSSYNTCYNNNNLTDIGRVTFLASSGSRSSNLNESMAVSELDQTNSNHLHLGIETADSGVTLDKDNEILGQPQDMSTPRRRTDTVPVSPDRTPDRTPSVPVPSRIHITEQTLTTTGTKLWVEPVSRSLLAHFYSSGVPELSSCTGDVLSYVDISNSPSSFKVDGSVLMSHLTSSTITIQMMGIEFLATPPRSAVYPSFTPSTVTIRYQFLHDIQTIAHLHLIKLSSEAHLPFMLSLEKGGTLQTFKSSHFIPSDVTDNEKRTILNFFMSSGRIVFSVFNSDSGIIIGNATLPLQVLSSSLVNSNVHIPLCLPIVYNDTHETFINTEPLVDGFSTVSVGVLYLSMGLSSFGKTIPCPPQPLATPTRSVVSYPLNNNGTPRTGIKIHVDRARKLARMKVARDQGRFTSTTIDDPCSVEDEKHSSISSVLINSLSSFVSIVSRFGEILYFEHQFCNKSMENVSVGIKWNNTDLCLVSSIDQVKHLRKHFNYKGMTDDPAILSNNGVCQYKMFMAPTETITLPFKYTNHELSLNDKEMIEVRFHDDSKGDENHVLSLLMVEVSVVHQVIDRIIHTYPCEGVFMRKDISVPIPVINSIHVAEGKQQLTAVSSDNNTTCCIKNSPQNKKQHLVVNLKAPVDLSPNYSEILLAMYNDQYMIAPIEVWKLCVQSVQRLEHSILIGQSSSLPLNIKGDHLNRKITYHAHTSNGLKVIAPTSHFIGAYSINESSISIKTLVLGYSRVLLSAKDDMTGDLVMVWCIDVTASRPSISRAFTVALSIGEEVEKNIKWTNPYPKKKTYYLSSTCPDIVSFTCESIKLHSSESSQLTLLFRPSNKPTSNEVILFISNRNDLIEECFSITVTCH